MDEITYNFNEILKKIHCTEKGAAIKHTGKLMSKFDVTWPRVSSARAALNPENHESFQLLYEQLDRRNCKELGRYVIFLHCLKSNSNALEVLNNSAKEQKENIKQKDSISSLSSRVEKINKPSIGSMFNMSNNTSYLTNNKFAILNYIDSSLMPLCQSRPTPLDTLERSEEERLVTNDILCCLMNNNGVYIVPEYTSTGSLKFNIDTSMNISIKGVVEEILKICTNVSVVAGFIDDYSGFDCGNVNQALAAALSTQLRAFRLEVCRMQQHQYQVEAGNLENGLTPAQILSWLQGPAAVMRTLAVDICSVIRENHLHGGTVLTTFCKRLHPNGSPKDRALLTHLMKCITIPFFRMLRLWIYRGIISDPNKEFFIYEHEKFASFSALNSANTETVSTSELATKNLNIIGPEYWSKRYNINASLVPKFLESHAEKILNTGKYLNVIQITGGDANFSEIEEMVYETDERVYEIQISRAYDHASKLLMDILFKENRLMDHFRFMKHYFLLEKADWVSHFMYLASDELNMVSSDDHISRLESLLDVAVQAGCDLDESLGDKLRVELSSEDLMFLILNIVTFSPDKSMSAETRTSGKNLRVLEAFSLSVSFEWPISLVFDSTVMQHYQILFRHIFYCHHVERVLSLIWLTNKCSNVIGHGNHRIINKANVLGGRMRTFVQSLLYYMTTEVIEPGWLVLEASINKANNIDEVFTAHKNFLNKCLLNCMLTASSLLRNLQKILLLCVTFSNHFNRLLDTENFGQAGAQANTYNFKSFEGTIQKTDRSFSEIINAMIKDIKTDRQRHKDLNTLLIRLEFNNFYRNTNEDSDVDI